MENEVEIAHMDDGHTYHFPILASGTVACTGPHRANPLAKRQARRALLETHTAARPALVKAQA